MCDFDDDFGDEGFMGDDSFEDSSEELMDDLDDTDDGFITDDHEPDEFTARGAFFAGSILGNAYEEALDERKRRELLRKKRFNRKFGFD